MHDVTGGRGFSAERAHTAWTAGLQSVSVSVDGTEGSHDALRGVRGGYDAALSALGHARAAGLQATANTQILCCATCATSCSFHRRIGAGIAAWQVQLTVPMGRAADEPEIVLEPYQLIEVMPMLARPPPDSSPTPSPCGLLARQQHRLLRTSRRAAARTRCPTVIGGACGAGRAALGLESNGNVKGCPSLPSDHSTSAVTSASTRSRTFRERSAPLRFMRDRLVDGTSGGTAKTCYYAAECLGGCSWTPPAALGDGPAGQQSVLPPPRPHVATRRSTRAAGPSRRAARALLRFLGVFDSIEEEWPDAELGRARAVARGEETWLARP